MKIKALVFIALLSFALTDLVFLTNDDAKKCAKVRCSGSNTVEKADCAVGTGAPNGARTITLNQCPADNFCLVNPTGDIETKDTEVKVDCQATTAPVTKLTRFAGEACEKDDECNTAIYVDDKLVTVSKCNEKVCAGMKEGEKCASHISCNVGLFCDAKEGKCAKQLAEAAVSTDTLSCQNDLILYDGKCSKPFVVKAGEDFGTKTDASGVSRVCETGYSEGTVCKKNEYDEDKTKSTDGYARCDLGSKCNYLTFSDDAKKAEGTKTELDCQCSMNTEGEGWCPVPSSGDKKKKSLTDAVATDRHTNARYNYKIGFNTKCVAATNNPIYFGITDCHRKALGLDGCPASSGYVKISLIVFAIIAAIFA
jgi:hypothetical protein